MKRSEGRLPPAPTALRQDPAGSSPLADPPDVERHPGWTERASVVAVLAVGGADLALGPMVAVGLLHLLPVAGAALLAPPRGATFVALLAGAAGGLALAQGGAPLPWWPLLAHLGTVALVLALGMALRRTRREAARLALLDPLTGLGNHRAFFHQVAQEVQRAGRYGRVFTVAYLDLDRFKEVNDTLGHQIGDEVLRVVGEVLRESLRSVDLAARLGGDEFGIVLPETALARAERALGKVVDALNEAMIARGWPVTASLGAVTFEAAPDSADHAVRLADRLMYRAKVERRGGLLQALWSGEEPRVPPAEGPPAAHPATETPPPVDRRLEGAKGRGTPAHPENHDLFSRGGGSGGRWASSA